MCRNSLHIQIFPGGIHIFSDLKLFWSISYLRKSREQLSSFGISLALLKPRYRNLDRVPFRPGGAGRNPARGVSLLLAARPQFLHLNKKGICRIGKCQCPGCFSRMDAKQEGGDRRPQMGCHCMMAFHITGRRRASGFSEKPAWTWRLRSN